MTAWIPPFGSVVSTLPWIDHLLDRCRYCTIWPYNRYQMWRRYRPEVMTPAHGQCHLRMLIGPDAVLSTHTIPTQGPRRRWCQPGELFISQPYELEQRNGIKYSCTPDGSNRVNLFALLILIKRTVKHLVVWTFPLFHLFPFARVRPPLSTLTLENNSLSWWAQGMT